MVEKWNELNSVLIILLITFTIPSIFEVKIISIVGIILSVGFFGIIRIKSIFLFFKKLTNKIKFLNKLEYGIENSYDSFRILTNFRNSIEGIVITTAAKIFEIFAIVALLNQIGIDLGYLVSAQIYFTGVLFGFLSFIPGGLIVTEGSMLTLFTKFTNDLALSAAAVILVRLFTLWLATFVGIVFSKFFIKKIKF
ncbi:MAG: hypothetical protein HW410_25 [Nitrosarchaeum sp.]|nr:hypothetical protein [Nitrosarchaeum sp.]